MHSSEPTSRHPARATPAVLLLSVLLGLGGVSCGQRGPLYLPEAQPDAAPAATNPPAEQAPAERAGQDAPPAPPARDEEDDEETP